MAESQQTQEAAVRNQGPAGGDLQGSAVTRAQTVKRMQQVWGEQCGEMVTPQARSFVYRPQEDPSSLLKSRDLGGWRHQNDG